MSKVDTVTVTLVMLFYAVLGTITGIIAVHCRSWGIAILPLLVVVAVFFTLYEVVKEMKRINQSVKKTPISDFKAGDIIVMPKGGYSFNLEGDIKPKGYDFNF